MPGLNAGSNPTHVGFADALTMGPPPPGNLAVPVFAHGSLEAELYMPKGLDPQKPHTRDEVYVVARGSGVFFDGSRRQPVESGSFLFVPAGQEHRFEAFSNDFAVWVFFYGREGGEAAHAHAVHGTGRKLEQIMPELPLTSVAAGVAHYRNVLGFTVNYADDNIAVMDRDEVRLLLIARTARHSGIGSCYVYVGNADALHADLVAKGANVLDEPVSRPWGLREFRVLDPEGNQLTFGQPLEDE